MANTPLLVEPSEDDAASAFRNSRCQPFASLVVSIVSVPLYEPVPQIGVSGSPLAAPPGQTGLPGLPLRKSPSSVAYQLVTAVPPEPGWSSIVGFHTPETGCGGGLYSRAVV